MNTFARNVLTEEERRVDPELGYPRGYAKLCRNAHAHAMHGLITPYTEGPPQRFLPYSLQSQDITKVKELSELFPIIESEERDPSNARRFADSLWEELHHLGNAGFDPAYFRIDPYGNVLYKNADPNSPLAWEVDHWFPHSRGGKTVLTNLRLVQWQVNQRKQNKLEFLVPWWDLQLGVSVNQFLSIFASKNSDFRQRAFSLLFYSGENEPLDEVVVANSHSWPQHFRERKAQFGLAPAAIVTVHKQAIETLKPMNGTPCRRRWTTEEEEALRRAIQRFGPGNWKEIKESEPLFRSRSTVQIKDKYRLIKGDWEIGKENKGHELSDKELILSRAVQKESRLKKIREDEIRAKEEEICQLNKELMELQEQNEVEHLALEDLASVLIKQRRRVEKHRRWSEALSSYRMCLEKMIADSMHQSIVYKEQGRLNQAACNALMARLETQKAACDASEIELIKRLKQREDLVAVLQPSLEEVRKKDITESSSKKNIERKLEESPSFCELAAECAGSAIMPVADVKGSDILKLKESFFPLLQRKEQISEISEKLRLFPEEKQSGNKSNMCPVVQNELHEAEMERVEVQANLSTGNPSKTAASLEKLRLSQAEESSLDVLIVGYEYEGARTRARETESVGENVTLDSPSDFKHSKFEGWSKEDCGSRIGGDDESNKEYKREEEDQSCKSGNHNQDQMLGKALELPGAAADAIAAETKEDNDKSIKNVGNSNLDNWQPLPLNPQVKEDTEPDNKDLPAIHDSFTVTEVRESNSKLAGVARNNSFRKPLLPHHKRASIDESFEQECLMHPNPNCPTVSDSMVAGISQLPYSEKQVVDILDFSEKFEALKLACDVNDSEKTQTQLGSTSDGGKEFMLEEDIKANFENPDAEIEIENRPRNRGQLGLDNEHAVFGNEIEVHYEPQKLNNCCNLEDVQRTEMALKGNAHYALEIRKPEGTIVRNNNTDNYMDLKGYKTEATVGTIVRKSSGDGLQRKEKESILKRNDSAGFFSNAYPVSSFWGMQRREGQSKERNVLFGPLVQHEEEEKSKEAKWTEEDGQQGLTSLKNGLSASIKTCTHMWRNAVKKLEGVAGGTDQK